MSENLSERARQAAQILGDMPLCPSDTWESRAAIVITNFWEAETLTLRQERDKAMRGLESLTPGGSEFVNDVERCVETVKYFRTSQLNLLKKFKLERDAEIVKREAAESSLSATREIVNRYMKSHGHDNIYRLECSIADPCDICESAGTALATTPQPADVCKFCGIILEPLNSTETLKHVQGKCAAPEAPKAPQTPTDFLPLNKFTRLIREGFQAVLQGAKVTDDEWRIWHIEVGRELPASAQTRQPEPCGIAISWAGRCIGHCALPKNHPSPCSLTERYPVSEAAPAPSPQYCYEPNCRECLAGYVHENGKQPLETWQKSEAAEQSSQPPWHEFSADERAIQEALFELRVAVNIYRRLGNEGRYPEELMGRGWKPTLDAIEKLAASRKAQPQGSELEKLAIEMRDAGRRVTQWMTAEGVAGRLRINCDSPHWQPYVEASARFNETLDRAPSPSGQAEGSTSQRVAKSEGEDKE